MKNACFLPKIAEGWDFGWFGKFHKIIKIGHFLKMKNFFESGFLMSHEGSFPMGVKLSKSKKVYPKCVVAQRLCLLMGQITDHWSKLGLSWWDEFCFSQITQN